MNAGMSRGIEGSKIFLVLATERFMKKVNDGDRADNCLKEFLHAGNQRSDRIVVAALEAEMANAATVWRGQFQLALARQTPVDVCSLSDEAIERLADAIRRRIDVPELSSRLTPLMRDIFPCLNPCSSEAWAQGKAASFMIGTRSWILDEVGNWYESRKSSVFVLVGDGGVGKSVIMAEICSRGGVLEGCSPEAQPRRKSSRVRSLWRRSGKQQRPPITVAAYHFFRHDESTASSPKEAVVSIAWQLCVNVEGFAGEVERVGLDLLRDKTLAEIFRVLLVGPLQKLGSAQARQVVVLDALDECKESDALLDKVIRPWKDAMPPWLSLVVSTRPEGDIVRGVNNNRLDRTVLELKDEENFRDIERHVERLLQGMSDVVEQEDIKVCAQTLARRSEGLFLWASFLPETLRDAQETKGDGSLLTKRDIEKEDVIPAGLGGMFKEYFGRLQDKVGGPETYATLLAPIVAAREPVGLKELTVLLGKGERKTKTIMGNARNLLHQGGDGRIALIHKRMADWLVDDDLSGNLGVDVEQGHHCLAMYCRDHDDIFALRHAIYHLVKSGDEAGAFGLLNDFSWVQKVVSIGDDQAQRRATIGGLLRDCAELGIIFAPETDTPRLLSKGLNALSWDPHELASQVLARLRVHEDDQNHPLVTSLRVPSGPWLRPVRPTLVHPHDPVQHVLEGHSERVNCVAIEGECVVSGSDDYTVRIWNATTGALQHVLEGHCGGVESVAVSGDRVVSGSFDKRICIWNATTGALQHVLKGHSGRVWGVAVWGDRVVSGSTDNTVRLWNATTGALQYVLEGHSKPIMSVAVDGDRVVSGSNDKTIRVWNAATGALQHVLKGHFREVNCVAMDGDRVVSGSADQTICIWNAATGTLQHVLEGDYWEITSVAVDGDRVVFGTLDSMVRAWDAATGTLQHAFEGHSNEVSGVAVEGDRVVSGSVDMTIRIWNAAPDALQNMLEGHSERVVSVAVDGDHVVSGSWDRTVRVWSAATGALRHVLEGHDDTVYTVTVNGDWVVSGTGLGSIYVWSASTGVLQHVLKEHSYSIHSVVVAGDRVLSASFDKTIRIWNVTTGALQSVLEGHSGEVCSVAVDGDRVVTGSSDNTARIWSAATGVLQCVLEWHADTVNCVAVNDDCVVSGSEDHTVCIWNAVTGALQHVLEGHASGVRSVAVESGRVMSRSDNEVCVWNAATGEALDENESEFFHGEIPVQVDNDTHVKLTGPSGTGFSLENGDCVAVRRGKTFVVGDGARMLHILR